MKDFSDKYRSFLIEEFSGINLTKILSKEDFYRKQVLDSILPLKYSPKFSQFVQKTGVLLDVGFGAGFPLVPLAHSLPAIHCCGIEAKAKKVEVVRQIGSHFALKNLHLWHGRLEELFIDIPLVVTFKAVGSVADCLKRLRTDRRVRAFFYKGSRFHELEDMDSLSTGWVLVEERRFPLPGTEGRIFLAFENTGDVGKKVGKSRKFTDVFGVGKGLG